MNKVLLLGNIGNDPELKVLGSGQSVLKFNLATNESWVKDGKKEERTEWHRLTMWGKRAEGLAPHLSKGDKVLVEGQIRTSTYEKDGEKRYSTNINVTDLHFAGGGKKPQSGTNPSPMEDASIPF